MLKLFLLLFLILLFKNIKKEYKNSSRLNESISEITDKKVIKDIK